MRAWCSDLPQKSASKAVRPDIVWGATEWGTGWCACWSCCQELDVWSPTCNLQVLACFCVGEREHFVGG